MSVNRVERVRKERRLHEVLQTYSCFNEFSLRAVMRASCANNFAFREIREVRQPLLDRNPGVRGGLQEKPLHERTDYQLRNKDTGGCVGATPLPCVEDPAGHHANHRGRITYIYHQALSDFDGGTTTGSCDWYHNHHIIPNCRNAGRVRNWQNRHRQPSPR